MIEKLLNVDLVEVDVKAENWEDAVRSSGLLLVENNKVSSNYVEAMVKTVKSMGAYIVMAKGVAMPHGRPEDGVLENSLSIIKLERPVVFGSEEFDPVTLVFALCAKDSEGHIELLKDLSVILDDETLIEKANLVKTKEDLIKLVLEIYNETLILGGR